MSENSWTREENEMFKKVLPTISPFSPTRFESIAEMMQKPVIDVKKQYKKLVSDLLAMGSNRVICPNENTDQAMVQSLNQPGRTIWDKETHEWFLIGLNRYGRDWYKIAGLLNTDNLMDVAIYGHNYLNWQNSKRANDITLEKETHVNVMTRREPTT